MARIFENCEGSIGINTTKEGVVGEGKQGDNVVRGQCHLRRKGVHGEDKGKWQEAKGRHQLEIAINASGAPPPPHPGC